VQRSISGGPASGTPIAAIRALARLMGTGAATMDGTATCRIPTDNSFIPTPCLFSFPTAPPNTRTRTHALSVTSWNSSLGLREENGGRVRQDDEQRGRMQPVAWTARGHLLRAQTSETPRTSETSRTSETLHCDSVRRKRKKKMNKHKHSKRRKLNKHKN
jgi:hypothetical protein